MKRHEVIDHTADVGLRAYGSTAPEIFESAAEGMFSLVTRSPVAEKGEIELHLEAHSRERLLVDWLSELLFLFETRGLLFHSFEVKLRGNKLDAKASGELYDPERHEKAMDIKAVTFHMLELNEKKGYAQVLFDI